MLERIDGPLIEHCLVDNKPLFAVHMSVLDNECRWEASISCPRVIVDTQSVSRNFLKSQSQGSYVDHGGLITDLKA
jgi:hypothetical protein